MTNKLKTDWVKLRAEWESSNKDGYAWFAKKHGIDASNMKKRMVKESWVKNTNASTNRNDAVLIEIRAVELPTNTNENTNKIPKRGRPTKYKPEYCDLIVDFFAEAQAYIELNHETDETRRRVFPKKFPTMARFASSIGVAAITLHEWASSKDENGELLYPDFSMSYKQSLEIQESLLLEGGLSGAYNPAITRFVLANHHGYRNEKEVVVDAVTSKRLEEHFSGLAESVLAKSKEKERVLEGRFERIAG